MLRWYTAAYGLVIQTLRGLKDGTGLAFAPLWPLYLYPLALRAAAPVPFTEQSVGDPSYDLVASDKNLSKSLVDMKTSPDLSLYLRFSRLRVAASLTTFFL